MSRLPPGTPPRVKYLLTDLTRYLNLLDDGDLLLLLKGLQKMKPTLHEEYLAWYREAQGGSHIDEGESH